ncbi:hypothetical protein SISSUDRAFT_1055347 [Sistotremastrum suecicum HHB10207 ss-3]|uniref:Uncharacterized protein n=1 Tax=Sistotremastrum suecicum HHB10207 ss-3 TaxID=1314776 RepID=A0A165XV15_9AGAM|nr:hypothetical protein SISSUDRAFT_1055347 [Sistotremastrum suecicum HHB10207 ss-3]
MGDLAKLHSAVKQLLSVAAPGSNLDHAFTELYAETLALVRPSTDMDARDVEHVANLSHPQVTLQPLVNPHQRQWSMAPLPAPVPSADRSGHPETSSVHPMLASTTNLQHQNLDKDDAMEVDEVPLGDKDKVEARVDRVSGPGASVARRLDFSSTSTAAPREGRDPADVEPGMASSFTFDHIPRDNELLPQPSSQADLISPSTSYASALGSSTLDSPDVTKNVPGHYSSSPLDRK